MGPDPKDKQKAIDERTWKQILIPTFLIWGAFQVVALIVAVL